MRAAAQTWRYYCVLAVTSYKLALRLCHPLKLCCVKDSKLKPAGVSINIVMSLSTVPEEIYLLFISLTVLTS